MPPKHPEQREGEIFYRNIDSRKEFKEIEFKTKRVGKIAYSPLEKEFELITAEKGLFPVFVQKLEFDQISQKKFRKIVDALNR
ncbi:hypothetical protein KAI56_04570 [Candidatus Parcubacteria bacterium]|nr:hypothetical protein [Candidatus Parcubacteria bacterium]